MATLLLTTQRNAVKKVSKAIFEEYFFIKDFCSFPSLIHVAFVVYYSHSYWTFYDSASPPPPPACLPAFKGGFVMPIFYLVWPLQLLSEVIIGCIKSCFRVLLTLLFKAHQMCVVLCCKF